MNEETESSSTRHQKKRNARTYLEDLFGLLFGSHLRILCTGLLFLFLFQIFNYASSRRYGVVIESFDNWSDWLYLAKSSAIYLLKDFGIALIVIFGIAISVEGPAKQRLERFNRQITENALESYLRHGLSANWFEYIRNIARQSEFIRHDLVLNLSIKRRSIKGESEKFVNIIQTVSYEIENLTADNKKYDVHVYIEKPIAPKHREECKCLSIVIDGQEISKEQLAEADAGWHDSPDGPTRNYLKKIDVAAKQTVRVKTVSQTLKYERDQFTWASIHAASGLTVECIPDSDVKAFITIMHPSSLTSTESEVGKQFSKRVLEPIFPATAAEIAWHPVATLKEKPTLKSN